LTDPLKLTVAIPTCNGGRHLASALQSIFAQAGADFAVLISDDRSEDQTLEIVRAEAGDCAHVSVNSERLGLARNWNRCVELAGTPLVAIFHQDDMMHPGHIAAHLAAFQSNPALGLVCSAAAVIDGEGREVASSVIERADLGPCDRVYPPGAFLAELSETNPVRCSGVTLSAKAHAESGGFDPSYRYVVDWDFWIRVATKRCVTWLAQPSVSVRWHSASETHRFKTGTEDLDETVRLLDAFYEAEGPHVPDAERHRDRAGKRLARAFLNRAYDASKAGDRPLVRLCLKRAFHLWPPIISRIMFDPRLLGRLMFG
jgi:glycosyltransferase involved in cell wall biosynthesis